MRGDESGFLHGYGSVHIKASVNGCSSLVADFLFALSCLCFSHFPLFTAGE